MERERSKRPVLMWLVLVGLLSQNVAIPVMSGSLEGVVGDQKNYYPPDPHPGTTPNCPKSPHKSPSYGTPSHGSGGSYGRPPQSGGGYYHSPPSNSGRTPPSITPPSPSVDPGTPSTPPLIPNPNTPPFLPGTCIYWRTHPELIWGLFGFWGTVVGAFGVAATSALRQNLTLQQALANTRRDGIGSLYREGTASLLNSMVNKKFPFTTQQVKDWFSAGLASEKAAAAQARLFKQANEGRLKPRA